MLGFSSLISAQCLTSFYGQYPFGSYVIPVCDGLVQNNITTCGYASEYSVVSVTSGETYTFGSSTTTDIVTISTDLGVTAETFGTGSVSWVATVTGDIWFYTSLDDGACGAENTCRTRYVICGIPPTCIAPSNLVSSNITTTSATVSWTTSVTDPAFGYEYYLSTSSTTPLPTDPATAGEAPGVTTTVLTDLIPATVYYVWVRSICSATDTSGWSSVVSFPTLCNPVTDFTESFDDALDLPVCWAKVGTGGSAYVQTSGTTTSPPNNLYFASWSATDLGIVSMIPVSNAGDGTHRLRFRARSNFTVGGVIEVGYLTDPSDDTTFVGLQNFTTTSTTTNSLQSQITNLGSEALGASSLIALVERVILNIDDIDFLISEYSKFYNEIELNDYITKDGSFYGSIIYRLISGGTQSETDEEHLTFAQPLSKNFLTLPVIGEIVNIHILEGKSYYEKISYDNSPNYDTNIRFVLTANKSTKEQSQNSTGINNYQSTQQTVIANSDLKTNKSETVKNGFAGIYFKRNMRIHQLALNEGDTLLQVRFGNSIRFSGYIHDDKNNGTQHPAILIRNGESNKNQQKKFMM